MQSRGNPFQMKDTIPNIFYINIGVDTEHSQILYFDNFNYSFEINTRCLQIILIKCLFINESRLGLDGKELKSSQPVLKQILL